MLRAVGKVGQAGAVGTHGIDFVVSVAVGREGDASTVWRPAGGAEVRDLRRVRQVGKARPVGIDDANVGTAGECDLAESGRGARGRRWRGGGRLSRFRGRRPRSPVPPAT